MSESETTTTNDAAGLGQVGIGGEGANRKPFAVMHHASAGGIGATLDVFDTFEEAEKDLLERVQSKAMTGSVSIYGPDHKGRRRLLYQECIQGYGAREGSQVRPWNPMDVADKLRSEYGWSEDRVERWLRAQWALSPYNAQGMTAQEVEDANPQEPVAAPPEPPAPPPPAAQAATKESPRQAPEIELPQPYETLMRWWHWARAVRSVLQSFDRDEKYLHRQRVAFLMDVTRRLLTHGKVLPVDVVAASEGRYP